MYRSARRQKGLLSTRRNRIIAIIGTLAVFGGVIAVTQVSNAGSNRDRNRPAAAQCRPAPNGTAPAGQQNVTESRQNGRTVRNYWGDGQACTTQVSSTPTISCPTVADRLPEVPARAREEVDRNLAQLETQIAEANRRLASSAGQGGPNFVQNAILGPLADKRRAALDRITIAIDRAGPRPQGLQALATCTVSNGNGGGGNNPGAPNQPATSAPPSAPPPLDFGPDECSEGNDLQLHDGFQNGN
ncbi:hypothetical protein ACTMTJ_26635, partial [Phytohabitans sp. LJ34]